MTFDNKANIRRSLSVIFADDLRQEIGGKISIVGMYGPQMIVPAFPITLPKLAVLITAITPSDQPFGKVSLQVLQDDQVLLSFDVDMSEQKPPEQEVTIPDLEIMEFQVAHVLSPLQIDGPCTLKARLTTESEIIGGRPLVIRATPPNATQMLN